MAARGGWAETLKEEVVEAAVLDSLRGRGQRPPLFSGAWALSLRPPPPPPPSPSASARSTKPGAGADGREGRGGTWGEEQPGLWQLPLRGLVRERGSPPSPPPGLCATRSSGTAGGDSPPWTQAAPAGTQPRLASCSGLLGRARRRAARRAGNMLGTHVRVQYPMCMLGGSGWCAQACGATVPCRARFYFICRDY